jgi:hypothetical protein
MKNLKDISSNDLREELKKRGYYTDNLWQIADVQNNYDVDEDTAYEILDRTLQLGWTVETIFSVIDEQAREIQTEIKN